MRRRCIVLAGMVLPLLVTGCVQQTIARGRVKGALVDAGLPPPFAQCLARRLVDRLTVSQLRKLKALQGPKRSVDDYLAAAQRVDDPQVLQVTIGSVGRCASSRTS